MNVGVTGHQVIPEIAVQYVRTGILGVLSRCDAPVCAFSSLAAGADQLFATIAVELAVSLVVVLPCARYDIAFEDFQTLTNFHRLLNFAERVEELPYTQPSEVAFLAAGQRIVDEADLLLAVWDGQPARGVGGTADVVRYARSAGKRVEVIWPREVTR